MFLLFKPAAYYGFILAFRYRASRAIPMTFGQTAKFTIARVEIGLLLGALGATVVTTAGSGDLLV